MSASRKPQLAIQSRKEQIEDQVYFGKYLQRALDALLQENALLSSIQEKEKLKLQDNLSRQSLMEMLISSKDSSIYSQIRKCEQELASQNRIRNEEAALNLIYLDYSSQRDSLINMISQIDSENNYNQQLYRNLDSIRLAQTDSINQLDEELISLEGRIRIVCRVRPLLEYEQNNPNCQHILNVVDEYKVVLRNPKNNSDELVQSLSPHKIDNQQQQFQAYQFMRVFGEESSQQDIFNYLNFFLSSSTSGQDVCVLAYGPTGSGKTWTMFGNKNDTRNFGLIPRSIKKLQENLSDLKNQGWDHSTQVSFVELYNSKAKDLIRNEFLSAGKTEGEFISISSDDSMAKAILDLYQECSENRIVRKTSHNKRSSRSHFIFTLKISSTHPTTGLSQVGSLSLVDLAGSEKLDKNQEKGEMKKETVFINSSLSVLAQVLRRLQMKEAPIPYRNSLLTQFLKRYLTPTSKTFMILNVSPNSKYFYQTQDTLSLACQVSNSHTDTGQQYKRKPLLSTFNSPNESETTIQRLKKKNNSLNIHFEKFQSNSRSSFYQCSPALSSENRTVKRRIQFF